MICTSSPWRWHMSIQRWLNMPNRAASTVSPGDSVLEIAASQPPVPVEGRMITSPSAIFSIAPHPGDRGLNIRAKAGERWSSVGMSQALRMLSGMLVGPGMKTGFWVDIGKRLSVEVCVAVRKVTRKASHSCNFFEMFFHFCIMAYFSLALSWLAVFHYL